MGAEKYPNAKILRTCRLIGQSTEAQIKAAPFAAGEKNIYQRSTTMLDFICYPKCSTCQKAQKWLDANGLAYRVRDIKAAPPSEEELAAWQAAKRASPAEIFQYQRPEIQRARLKRQIAGNSGRTGSLRCSPPTVCW